jgi:hypothetical protein
VCFFRSVPGPKRLSFIAFVTSEQATALPIVTTKSRRFMGVFASGRKTPYHRANSARYCASQQFCTLDFRFGSISATESLLTHPSRRVGLPSESRPYSRSCIGRQLGATCCREHLQQSTGQNARKQTNDRQDHASMPDGRWRTHRSRAAVRSSLPLPWSSASCHPTIVR